jgi:hypothetical protein
MGIYWGDPPYDLPMASSTWHRYQLRGLTFQIRVETDGAGFTVQRIDELIGDAVNPREVRTLQRLYGSTLQASLQAAHEAIAKYFAPVAAKPLPATLPHACEHCGVPLTLTVELEDVDDASWPVTFACPACRERNVVNMPGRVISASIRTPEDSDLGRVEWPR